jgi:hypothetical protein
MILHFPSVVTGLWLKTNLYIMFGDISMVFNPSGGVKK